MAISGLILFSFVVGHLAGNLQIFQHPDHINGYAQFLHNLGPGLWIARIVLLTSVGIHVWAATALALENQKARGDQPMPKRWIRASLSSRWVRWTGYIVLGFVGYHLAQFTLGLINPDDYKSHYTYVMYQDYKVFGLTVIKAGTEVQNVYLMVYRCFESAPVSIFYIIAVGLLAFHLEHGLQSMFQTFGWRSGKWAGALSKAVTVICWFYFLGNLAIPCTILTGALKPNPDAHVHEAPTSTVPLYS